MKAIYNGIDCGKIKRNMVCDITIDESGIKVYATGNGYQYSFTYSSSEKLKEDWKVIE